MGAEVRTTATEAQLADARKARKHTDDQLQTLLNRISFLRSEEAKLDRDIENARKRAQAVLSQKAERANDDDVVGAARDVLSVMQASLPSSQHNVKQRPGTGRSSSGRASITGSLNERDVRRDDSSPSVQRSSNAKSGSASSTSSAPTTSSPGLPKPRAMSAQRPTRASSATGRQQAGASPSAAGAAGHPKLPRSISAAERTTTSTGATAASAPVAERSSDTSSTAHHTSSSKGGGSEKVQPPLAPRPAPAAAVPASSSATSSTHTPPPKPKASGGSSRSTSGRSINSSSSTSKQQSAPIAADHGSSVQSQGSASTSPARAAASSASGSELLPASRTLQEPPTTGLQQLHPGTAAAGGVPPGGATAPGAAPGPAMQLLASGRPPSALAQRSPTAAAQQLQGLQQFSTQVSQHRVTRVVNLTSTSTASANAGAAGSISAVLAAGVGWGLGAPRPTTPAGSTTVSAPVTATDPTMQAEMAKKQQIWKLRKTFGLQATPLKDATAQVAECGAGAWQ